MKSMTKLILSLVACLLIIDNSFSQGNNLQFGKVLLIETLSTVPANKVWKVESVLSKSALALPTPGTYDRNLNDNTAIQVNSNSIIIYSVQLLIGGFGTAFSKEVTKLPFWLPAGSTLNISTNVQYISVIEYNLIP
jgi:hypothetical protein